MMSDEEDRAEVGAFNHYNTDVVKHDATNSIQMATGDLVRPARPEESLDDGQELDRFALLKPDYELLERSVHKDSNKSFTDVTFIVGPPQHSKKYVGHRVLLAMTSPVFETMFYGDMADKSKYIRIADVAPIGFENLLRYAYTDSLNLNSVEDAMLTAYGAKKYLLPQLLRECLTYIEHNIGPSTACVVFEFAHVLNSQQLVLQAMNLIDRQTINVVSNKSFHHVQASTVEFVANRKYLSLDSEFTLFKSVVGWAQAEARRRNIVADDWSSIRLILSESSILAAVRFLAMSQEEFSRAVAKTSSTIQVATYSTHAGLSSLDADSSQPAALDGASGTAGMDLEGSGEQQPLRRLVSKVNPNDPNSLLNDREQRAVFLNLNLGDVAELPASLSESRQARLAPPEYFSLRRFKSSSNLSLSTTTTRNIKSITSKFQCLSENVFIVGLTIPIRLDASSYANRTPKFECHLKFSTKTTGSPSGPATSNGATKRDESASASGPGLGPQMVDELSGSAGQQQDAPGLPASSTLLMDTIDESLHISIARDKDCLVRLKRPILVRMGNINELTLTFQTYALDEDIVALRTPKLRSGNFSEQTDGENISWLFFKSMGIEFSELHYYY